MGHTAGNRPSVWHLISRRPARETAANPPVKPHPGDARPVENVPLPPSRRDGWVSHLEENSPTARMRAPETKSPSEQPQQRARRCAPRPLHVQKLAAGIVAKCQGLDTVHPGHICDALTGSGLDLDAWTARAITDQLDADMRARGWSWPDRIERPGAFLATRLRRLPVRPDGPHRGGVTAASLDSGETPSGSIPLPHSPQPRTTLEPRSTPASVSHRAAALAEIRAVITRSKGQR